MSFRTHIRKGRMVLGLALAVAAAAPLARAVFKEENLLMTLQVLLDELRGDYENVTRQNSSAERRIESQHQQLVKLVEQSNELSLMLYSQPQDYTFDLTYALHQATKQYNQFNDNRMPFDEIVTNMSVELERYSKLAQTLRNIPPVRLDPSSVPQAVTVMDSIDVSIDTLAAMPSFAVKEGFELDSTAVAVRDSCLALAERLVDHYFQRIRLIERDSQYYEETDLVLKEAYDYAQTRYDAVQKQVFFKGQTPYARILQRPSRYFQRAVRDIRSKYGRQTESFSASGWKGPVVAGYGVIMLLVMLLAIFLANLLVRFTVRWVSYFQTEFFQQHRGMMTTMIGLLLFAVFLLVSNATAEVNSFKVLASRMMGEFTVLLATIFLSLLIRMKTREQTRSAILAYLPTLLMAFIVIFCRIVFVPNSVLNVFFPPLLLVFAVWQLVVNLRRTSKVPRADRVLLWISCLAMVACTVLSLKGLIMMSVLILIWWFFQLMLLQGITAVSIMLDRYHENHVLGLKAKYREKHPRLPLSNSKGAFIEVTWVHDLLKMMVLPLLAIWSLPLSIVLATKVFSLTGAATDVFFQPFLNVENVVHLSLFKLVMVLSLYFVFRFLVYVCKAFYRVLKARSVLRKLGENGILKETDINFNLADNVIALILWGIYVITAFLMLKIPTSALAIITTGLATGIGFAMKDVLNNFFYGVQLMSGRVRVGDTIECDGVRGKVENLSYQSTQVASEEGSMIVFTNTALFNKNFKNLTRNHHYEMINFTVGVKYGTDIEKARKVMLDALQPLLVKDRYGRDVVDMKKGIAIRLRNFGDSAIDMQVLLFSTVETHYSFAAAAKEAIYNAFAANGIEIPFPQRDVYIKEKPSDNER